MKIRWQVVSIIEPSETTVLKFGCEIMVSGIAIILVMLFAPVEIYIYFTQGEDAWFEFIYKIGEGYSSIMDFLLNDH